MDLGDRTEDSTFDFMFSTRNVSAAPAALASGVISVYKANGTTQSTAGITLTASFDGVTGLNHIRIITTDAFYAAANDYIVVITTGTVNSVSVVGTTIATFSIENRFMRGTDSALLSANINLTAGAVDNVTTVATTTTNTDMRGTDSAATATALATVDTNVDAILVDTGTDIPARFDGVEGATFATGTDSLEAIRDRGDAAWVTGAGGSSPTVAQIVDGVWDELQSAHTTANTFGKFLDVEVSSISGGSGLTSQQTRDAMKLAPTGGAPATGSIDEHLDDILVDTGTTLPATLATLSTQASVNTIDTNVDSILVDTGTTIPAQITALNDFNPTTDTVVTVTTTGTVTDGAKATALATAQLDLDTITGSDGATLATLQPNEDFGAVRKNTAFSNFTFLMVLTSDHVTPATGLTVTGQRSLNGGTFSTVTGTIAEVSNGIYQFDALAADTNGDVITWRFSSGTADDTFVTFKTVA